MYGSRPPRQPPAPDPQPSPFARSATIRDIIAEVAKRHRITPELILSHRRSSRIVKARWEAIRIVHERYPEIKHNGLGRIFHKDHSTIRYAIGMRTPSQKKAAVGATA